MGEKVVTGLASFDEALEDSDVLPAVEDPLASFDEDMDLDPEKDFQGVQLIVMTLFANFIREYVL